MYKLSKVKYIPNDIKRLKNFLIGKLRCFWINKIYLKYLITFEEWNTPYQKIVGNFEYDNWNRNKKIIQRVIILNGRIRKIDRVKLNDIFYKYASTNGYYDWEDYLKYWNKLVEGHKKAGTLIQICKQNIPLIKSFYTNKNLQK